MALSSGVSCLRVSPICCFPVFYERPFFGPPRR
jgi:hypothetical protein